MKQKITSTHKRLLLYLFLISAFLLTLFIYLYHYTTLEKKEVYDKIETKFSNEVTTLLNLNSKPLYHIAVDYTYWDEFIHYIENEKTPETNNWYEVNVGSGLLTFDVDYFSTYNADGNFIIESKSEKIKSTQIFSKDLLLHIYKERLTKFYYTIPEGILEVYGATIHPYSDPEKSKTKPEGIFIVAKLLDTEYFTNLEEISGSKIEVLATNYVHLPDKLSVSKIIELKTYNNENLAILNFKRPFTLGFNTSQNILLIIIISFLIALIIFIVLYQKMVANPLILVTEILENNKHNTITKLESYPGEFGNIGKLFLINNTQKENLKHALAKAKESDLLKTAFLTNLSHEIRTPMNGIVGFSGLLNNNDLSDEKKSDYLKIIIKSSDNLLAIIDDLIEIAMIDSNQIKPKYTSFDLDETMLEIKNTVEVTIPQNKPLKIIITKPKNSFNNPIISDITKLKQIFSNLLTNAVKFTDKGEIHFDYNVNYQDNTITFNIKDEGIGISDEDKKNIFNRFERSQSDRNIAFRGLGLGLAIIKEYVDMLGGKIWIESRKDVGSTFSFTIPLKIDAIDKKKEEIDISSFEIKPLENFSILVAEDDDSNFMLIDAVLSESNYSIIRAKDGIEAVNICKTTTNIGLVLMDIRMPLLNGIQAQQQIKEFRPKLPIVAYTANISAALKTEIFETGFTDYLTKPLNTMKLLKIIETIGASRLEEDTTAI